MRSNIVSLRINVALGLSFTPCLLRTITARTIIGTVIYKKWKRKIPHSAGLVILEYWVRATQHG
jgi:hypothetical protein